MAGCEKISLRLKVLEVALRVTETFGRERALPTEEGLSSTLLQVGPRIVVIKGIAVNVTRESGIIMNFINPFFLLLSKHSR